MRAAVVLFGLATIATGVVDLIWGAFDPMHQPIQAFGDDVPGRQALAYLAGVALVVGGAAVVFGRTARFGAIVLAAVYGLMTVFWLPRLFTAPAVLGYSAKTYIGVLAGIGLELIVVCAALTICASQSPRDPRWDRPMTVIRWVFALCTIDFGLQHLTGVANPSNTEMVPPWMPFGQAFWIVFTGIAFVLAGCALLTGLLDVLAGRLLALMLFAFSVVTLLPLLAASPSDEANWGGNAYEFVAVASAWILAEWLASRKRHNRTRPA
jgi:uncharacterized membrane protein YphA (DoxX/SURF4 family)